MLKACYNSLVHSATGYLPFELATGKVVNKPLSLLTERGHEDGEEYNVDDFLNKLQATLSKVHFSLQKSKFYMTKQVLTKGSQAFHRRIWCW